MQGYVVRRTFRLHARRQSVVNRQRQRKSDRDRFRQLTKLGTRFESADETRGWVTPRADGDGRSSRRS
jgi:hypothetical protein